MKLSLKKHKLVSILVILAILFTLNPVASFAAVTPDDISGHWAEEQIQSWVDSGYIQGYPDGTFKPDNNITRAEFMTITNNAFGYTEKTEISYSDVTDGSWYADTVAIAKAAGYITGYPDGTMKPDSPITRQEAAVIIAKINTLESDETAADVFTDGADIASWSKGSIGACVEANIFNGYPDGSFLAENLIERGESVVALSKALAYTNAPVSVEKAVTGISAAGFHLDLSPAVDGLTQSAIAVMQNDNNVTVEAITTENGGASYAVTADLEEGQTYTLSLEKDGYDFGDNVTFEVLTAQQAADSVTEKISALPNAEDITLDDSAAVSEAESAYDALTEAQKLLISTDSLTKLNDAIAKIDNLRITEGETGSGQEE